MVGASSDRSGADGVNDGGSEERRLERAATTIMEKEWGTGEASDSELAMERGGKEEARDGRRGSDGES